jgi:hypothetical protein
VGGGVVKFIKHFKGVASYKATYDSSVGSILGYSPGSPSSVLASFFTGWTTGRSGFDPRRGQRNFPLSSVSRPALGPTQPPVQWVPGVLSQGVKRGRGVMLTSYSYLVPRSWMSRSYTSSPPQAPPWRVEGLLYFLLQAIKVRNLWTRL